MERWAGTAAAGSEKQKNDAHGVVFFCLIGGIEFLREEAHTGGELVGQHGRGTERRTVTDVDIDVWTTAEHVAHGVAGKTVVETSGAVGTVDALLTAAPTGVLTATPTHHSL